MLPSIGKRCAFPNLALPTVAGLTPAGHEVVLCDENVEPIDFDTDADVVGITGFAVHTRRIFEISLAFRRRRKLVAAGPPFAPLCPGALRGRVDVLFVGGWSGASSGSRRRFAGRSPRCTRAAPSTGR